MPGHQLAVEVKRTPPMSVGYLGISAVCVCALERIREHTYTSVCVSVCVSEPICVGVGLPASLGVCVCTRAHTRVPLSMGLGPCLYIS